MCHLCHLCHFGGVVAEPWLAHPPVGAPGTIRRSERRGPSATRADHPPRAPTIRHARRPSATRADHPPRADHPAAGPFGP